MITTPSADAKIKTVTYEGLKRARLVVDPRLFVHQSESLLYESLLHADTLITVPYLLHYIMHTMSPRVHLFLDTCRILDEQNIPRTRNRIALLQECLRITMRVADFSKLVIPKSIKK